MTRTMKIIAGSYAALCAGLVAIAIEKAKEGLR